MADHLPSLKRAPSKKSSLAAEVSSESEFPLSLYVSTEEITVLGLQSVKLGEERMLIAKVRVTSLSENESEGEDKYQSVGLSLVEGTTSEITSKKDAAELLFGKE